MTCLALTGVVAAPGCAEVDSEMFIRAVVARRPPDCIAAATAEAPTVVNGFLDVSLRSEYVATLLVGNQVLTRGDPATAKTETSRVGLVRAEVSVENASGTQLNSFEVPITGFVNQALGLEPGFGLATVTLIDSKAASLANAKDASLKRLVSKVRVFGKTLGGAEVQSNEFQFIIFACKGCLINYPDGTDDPNIDGRDCTLPGTTDLQDNAGACLPGQDTPIDCRICHAAGRC